MRDISLYCVFIGMGACYLGGGIYLLCLAYECYAGAHKLWLDVQERKHQRELEIMERMIALQGGNGDEPERTNDPRLGTPDGSGDFGNGQELPLRERAPGRLGAILSDLQDGAGALRGGTGEDDSPAPATE